MLTVTWFLAQFSYQNEFNASALLWDLVGNLTAIRFQ